MSTEPEMSELEEALNDAIEEIKAEQEAREQTQSPEEENIYDLQLVANKARADYERFVEGRAKLLVQRQQYERRIKQIDSLVKILEKRIEISADALKILQLPIER
jgi:chromosome segregation ATPase